MANVLTEVTPKLLAQGLMALREYCVMPRMVNRDYDTMAAQQGSTIDIPIPSAVATRDVTPSNSNPSTPDSSPTSVAVPLDQWKEAPFYLTDKETLEIMNGVIPMQASEAIKSLANTVNGYIMDKYKGVYGFAGAAGTTPFASSMAEATEARKNLNVQLAPTGDRRFILDPDAEANALDLRALQDASYSGSAAGLIEGSIGRKMGFDWFMDQLIPTHTAGTITTGLVSKAATPVAEGAKTLIATTAATTGACDLKEGDIITFAGDDQTYVLTADAVQASPAADVTLNFYPGLKVALTGGDNIEVKDSHVVNLAFHRDAIAFATRPLAETDFGMGNVMSSVDPVSGLALRLEITREHKRTTFSYDILYGGKLVRPELATRVAG